MKKRPQRGCLQGLRLSCHKQDTQCTRAAMAGNYTACGGNENFLKMLQAVQIIIYRLYGCVITVGMGNENPILSCLLQFFFHILHIIQDDFVDFAAVFLSYDHAAIFHNDFRMQPQHTACQCCQSATAAAASMVSAARTADFVIGRTELPNTSINIMLVIRDQIVFFLHFSPFFAPLYVRLFYTYYSN